MGIWLPIALAGASMLQQGVQARDQRKNQEAQNWLESQRDRTSYITGRGGKQSFNAQSPYTAMLGGAIQGASAGVAMDQNMQNAAAQNSLRTAQAGAMSNPYQSMTSYNPSSWNLKSGYGGY